MILVSIKTEHLAQPTTLEYPPFLVVRLCAVSLVVRFLPVSPPNLESQLSTYMFDVVFKRKPRENIKVCVNVSRTSYRQATDRLPTHYQQSADCRPTGSLYFRQNLSAVCRPTDGQLSADCRPTGFLGSSSSQLPKKDSRDVKASLTR